MPHTNPVEPAFMQNLDQLAARFEGRSEATYICRSAKKYVFIRVDRRAYGQTDDRQSTTGRTNS